MLLVLGAWCLPTGHKVRSLFLRVHEAEKKDILEVGCDDRLEHFGNLFCGLNKLSPVRHGTIAYIRYRQ